MPRDASALRLPEDAELPRMKISSTAPATATMIQGSDVCAQPL